MSKSPSEIIAINNALGTHWKFEFFENINVRLIRTRLQNEIKKFEYKYSRFRKDSLLTKLNIERKLEGIDEEFLELLSLGLEFYKKTEGVFNIGLGKHLENIGYGSDYKLRITNHNFTSSFPDLIALLTFKNNSVYLNGEGDIDLGGIGKGYLVDKLVRILQKDYRLKYFIVNGGGDIYVSSDHGKEVEIFLQNPHNIEEIIDKVELKDCSICGSSPNQRKWGDIDSGKELTHIIDPKNRNTTIKNTFIIAEKTVVADILATTLSIQNDEQFIQNLLNYFDFGYKIIA